MPYLDPSEYEAYGLASDTPGDIVQLASALIDAHCRRSTLLAAQYTERFRLAATTLSARLSYLPVAEGAISSARIRYGRPRRGEMQETMLTQAAWAFSLPGSWSSIPSESLDLDLATGEITFPQNVLGVPYNEAEITYTAGFSVAPQALKAACAQVVRNAQATPALNVRGSRMDTLQMQYFSSSLLDESVRALLAPYVAQKVA